MRTRELMGRPLDWAVEKCGGTNVVMLHDLMRSVAEKAGFTGDLQWQLSVRKNELWAPNGQGIGGEPYVLPSYSVDWGQGGPILEREHITVWFVPDDDEYPIADGPWSAHYHHADIGYTGPTPLVAAMRCYVASKLGDEVEIPMGLG